jgi:D-sedoheptulose 7-phosphate isomerase
LDELLNKLCAGIEQSIEVKQLMLKDVEFLTRVVDVGNVMVAAVRRGNRLIFAGNGGSAADAQHLAAEFVSRFEFDRPGLAALSLSTDTSMITAIGNDYGYEMLFRRQLEAQARPGDVFIGITTSGKSKNVLAAFARCRDLGVTSVALAGMGGDLEGQVDYALRVPSHTTARIQESHITLGHMLCAQVELAMFSHLKPQ